MKSKKNTCSICSSILYSNEEKWCEKCNTNNPLCLSCFRRDNCCEKNWIYDDEQDTFSCVNFTMNNHQSSFGIKDLKFQMQEYIYHYNTNTDENSAKQNIFYLQQFLNHLDSKDSKSKELMTISGYYINQLEESLNIIKSSEENKKIERAKYLRLYLTEENKNV